MTGINKTLFIPLYGKAYVSKKNIILSDSYAEKIWDKNGFKLKAKSRSRWLAYYMGMRARVFDDWILDKLKKSDATVIHIGCGLDSRAMRVGAAADRWYDLDFPEVIEERRHYFDESDSYRMLSADIREEAWLEAIPTDRRIILVMEGVSMYLSPDELTSFISRLCQKFDSISLLMDCYTVFAAKASKYKNPINDVGVNRVYGIDEPRFLEGAGIKYIGEHNMTPDHLIDQLSGIEKSIFRKVYGGKMSKKLYKLYEYSK